MFLTEYKKLSENTESLFICEFFFSHIPESAGIKFDANEKYTRSDIVSTIVVINGLAITAGSRCTAFAATGRRQPTSFAIHTVISNVAETTSAIVAPPSAE